MKEKMIGTKTAMAACLSGISAVLGWKGILMCAWVAVMALDYLSGTLAACREGQWNSAAARQGLWHKGGMILVVTVAAIADAVMAVLGEYVPIGIQWPGLVLPLVLAWYMITELGSILENAVKMGAAVPEWLVRLMKVSLKLTESAGDSAVTEKE